MTVVLERWAWRSFRRVEIHTPTGARDIAMARTAQVRIATCVWSRTTEPASEVARRAAQNRWMRKVSSRSGLASPPFGVTTKRLGRRMRASPKDFR